MNPTEYRIAFDADRARIAAEAHPTHRNMLRFFEHQHLPGHLQLVSIPFGATAYGLVSHALDTPADGPEVTVALRKLLEAKDAAVRAFVHNPEVPLR